MQSHLYLNFKRNQKRLQIFLTRISSPNFFLTDRDSAFIHTHSCCRQQDWICKRSLKAELVINHGKPIERV